MTSRSNRSSPMASALAALVVAASVAFAAPAKAQLFFDWGGGTEKPNDSGRLAGKFSGDAKPGEIIVSFSDRRLYLVTQPGQAISYPIAIPREQDRWEGKTSVTQKRENPSWTPTPTMIKENPKLPRWVPGGHPMNPLGVRALYLGSSFYRIHGTDAPWTIGTAVSKGCIRMYNKDAQDVYERVKVGAKVLVTWNQYQFTPNAEQKIEEPAVAAAPAPKGGASRSKRAEPPADAAAVIAASAQRGEQAARGDQAGKPVAEGQGRGDRSEQRPERPVREGSAGGASAAASAAVSSPAPGSSPRARRGREASATSEDGSLERVSTASQTVMEAPARAEPKAEPRARPARIETGSVSERRNETAAPAKASVRTNETAKPKAAVARTPAEPERQAQQASAPQAAPVAVPAEPSAADIAAKALAAAERAAAAAERAAAAAERAEKASSRPVAPKAEAPSQPVSAGTAD